MTQQIKCPCEECISLAICYQKDILNCEDLYYYICLTDPDVPRISSFRGYHRGRGIPVLRLYDRWIEKTNILKKTIKLTHNEKRRTVCLYISKDSMDAMALRMKAGGYEQ